MISTKLDLTVTACQQGNEWKRPNAATLLQTIRQFTSRNSGVVEKLMKKVSQYAEELQHVVAERTRALTDETRKVDNLLLEMLPQYVRKNSFFNVKPTTLMSNAQSTESGAAQYIPVRKEYFLITKTILIN